MLANIRYFVRESRYMLIFGVVYAALMIFINGSDNNDYSVYLTWIIFSGFLCMLIFTISMYKKDIPLAISFSQRRSDVFVGTIAYVICQCVYVSLECVLVKFAFNITANLLEVIVVAVLFAFVANAMGVLVGICWQKFGRIVAVAVIFLLSAGVGVITSLGIIRSAGGFLGEGLLTDMLQGDYLVPAILLGVWSVVMILHRHMVMDFRVHL